MRWAISLLLVAAGCGGSSQTTAIGDELGVADVAQDVSHEASLDAAPETTPEAIVIIDELPLEPSPEADAPPEATFETWVDPAPEGVSETGAELPLDGPKETTELPSDAPGPEAVSDAPVDVGPVDCSAIKLEGYTCPDGTTVPWCGCTASLGVRCLEHPEYQCPTLCGPMDHADYVCPDGSHVPWCSCKVPPCTPKCKASDAGEGWYDCSGELLAKAKCTGCMAICRGIGSKSEGWYDSCSGNLIHYDQCSPTWECQKEPWTACSNMHCTLGQSATYQCRDGAEVVPWCTCQVPGASCKPECQNKDGKEGYYDPCTGELVKEAKCTGCTVQCDKVGSKSEGWYDDCSGLIAWAYCATGTWQCDDAPWTRCTAIPPCVEEGGQFTLGGKWQTCCPGSVEIDWALWDGKNCAWPDCLCKACTLCGDGKCVPPENPCDCPADCPK